MTDHQDHRYTAKDLLIVGLVIIGFVILAIGLEGSTFSHWLNTAMDWFERTFPGGSP